MISRPVARRAWPCDVGIMGSDRSSIPPARPAQFVVGEDEHGNAKLDVVEGTLEQTYRVGDHHSVTLFVALIRSKGLLPYRRPRQHEGTICLRATLPEHDAIWSEFLELDRRLGAQLVEVTHAFVRQHAAPNKP
jgi:hypothetical protein